MSAQTLVSGFDHISDSLIHFNLSSMVSNASRMLIAKNAYKTMLQEASNLMAWLHYNTNRWPSWQETRAVLLVNERPLMDVTRLIMAKTIRYRLC